MLASPQDPRKSRKRSPSNNFILQPQRNNGQIEKVCGKRKLETHMAHGSEVRRRGIPSSIVPPLLIVVVGSSMALGPHPLRHRILLVVVARGTRDSDEAALHVQRVEVGEGLAQYLRSLLLLLREALVLRRALQLDDSVRGDVA
jgi:hypothetical protein